MLTVRFENGFSIQYNSASYTVQESTYTNLYTRKDGIWIATVPRNAVIEAATPCRMYFATDDNLKRENAKLLRQVARLKKASK